MANTKDELGARRWFRQRLAELGMQYPELKDPAHQQRLTQVLEEGIALPRQPTGRPTGRPPGSGRLGDEGVGHKRLTVRLPVALYNDLEAEAEAACEPYMPPDLARTVRSALAHYLTCPHRRQTGSGPHTILAHNGQTENDLEPQEDHIRQTEVPPHLAKAALVARLKKLRNEGMSLQKIADQLRAEGVPTLTARGQWHKEMVARLVG